MRETYEALRSLGHSEHDARRLVEAALEGKTKYKTVEDMLQAIYQNSHKK
jgi:Holliday junction DNA helicase RuvA